MHNPYTYRITWSALNKHYYGVRFAKGCTPDDLFVTYFTSSKYVASYIKEHGYPDIIQVRKVFVGEDSINRAREWEHRVLTKLNVTDRDDYINKSTGKSIPVMRGCDNPMSNPINRNKQRLSVNTEEVRLKQSLRRKERVANGTHHFLGSGVNAKRIRDGNHPFVGHDLQGVTSRRRVQEGTHNFIGLAEQLLKEGRHASQREWVCEACGKAGKGSTNYIRWHGSKCHLVATQS